MENRIGILLNPKSRRNRKTGCSLVGEFQSIGGKYADVFATNSVDELDERISMFRDREYAYVGISGGDGTIHTVTSRMMEIYGSAKIPPILLLSDGTMNNVASSLGLNKRSTHILRLFIERLEKNRSFRIVRRDTVRIGGRHCFLFGFGTVTAFLKEVYIGGGNRGVLSNIRALGITFGDVFNAMVNRPDDELMLLKPIEAEISIDGVRLPFTRINTVLGGTVPVIGMGFNTLYRANDYPGKFHVIINSMSPVDLMMEINRIRAGQPIESEFNIDETVSEMNVTFNGELDYTMDGDLYTAKGKLDVYAGRPLDFIII